MYACVGMFKCTLCNRFFSFFVPVGPLGLIVRHFRKKSSNAAMPQCHSLVRTPPMTQSSELRQDLKLQPAWSFQFFKGPGCWSAQGLNKCQVSYKKLQPFFKDFSRTTLDFHGQPSRNIISQIVQKCTFPVYSKKTFKSWTVCFTKFSTFPKIQGLFKTVRTLHVLPCRPALSQLS